MKVTTALLIMLAVWIVAQWLCDHVFILHEVIR